MIIGSDLIRNNYGNYIQAINEIIDDVSSKPGVSKDRIYIAGFSGGARMAFEFARHSAVKGVLMCSAGPNIQSLAELPCPIYMIGGTTDFNFPETWMNPLNNQDNSNYVTDYFRGTHEWPPVDKLRQGLLYLLAQSGTQEKGLLTRESNILTASADSLWESKDYLMALKAAEKALLFNPGNKKAQDLKKKITGCKPCTDPINAIEKDLSLEYRITGEYAKMLHQKDSTWWFREIDYITDEIAKNSGNSKDHLQRIKGFLGIMFYSAIGDLINREPDNKQLVHLLAAYQKAEPENPDVYYYRALYAYTQNRKERCREFLQKARNLGFIDSVKLKKDFPPGF
jgi:tetratricopeptide (TPR) repeat protein